MKRTVALWAAASILFLTALTGEVRAQYEKPTTPPATPPQQTPPDTTGQGAADATSARRKAPGSTAAPADTMTTAARIRRAQASKTHYVVSLGLGSSINSAPEAFTTEYDPSFGFYLDGGVRRAGLELTLSFDFNFFFTTLQPPDDMNVMTLFLNLKYRPLKTTARPYVLGCAGWFRSWIVDQLDPATGPQTVVHEYDPPTDNYYTENVLGYGVGGGVEIEIDKLRRIFFEARYIEGETRLTQNKENMAFIPMRLGLTWEF